VPTATTHYVPILKSKDGEFRSLAEIPDAISSALTPLIEIVPPGVKDWKTGQRHTVDDHLDRVHRRLVKSWTSGRRLLVDFLVDPAEPTRRDTTAAAKVLAELRMDAINATPVTRLDSSLVYQDEVRKAIRADDLGVCVRLSESDFNVRTLPRRLADLISFFDIAPEEVDVLLDLGHIRDAQVAPMVLAAQSAIATLPHVERLRTLALASSSFPSDLGCCKPQAVTRLDRSDWTLWNDLRTQPGIVRVPSYADYAIAHPDLVDFDPRRMRMSASIRYTTEAEFLVAKGRAIDAVGWEQTRVLAGWITADADFKGAAFSAGDDYIARRAVGAVTSGHAPTWRRVGTTHHLTLAVTQLASLGGP
jgi:hypothetical protein